MREARSHGVAASASCHLAKQAKGTHLSGFFTRASASALAFAAPFFVPQAGAMDRYVSMAGRDAANTCASSAAPCASLTHVIGQAASGDTINVAGGRYRDNVRLEQSTTLTFLGGWDASFASRDPRANPAIVSGGHVDLPTHRGRDRVWSIFAWSDRTIDVTIDGFVLRGGRAGTRVVPDLPVNLTADGRAAGGLAAVAFEDSAVTLRLSNSIVTRNQDEYGGAGLSLWALDNSTLDVTLDGVQVTHNKVADSAGAGGGILIFAAPYVGPSSTLSFRMTNSVVADNVTPGGGGGLLASNYGRSGSTIDVAVTSSTITRNLARNASTCPSGCLHLGGGGIYAIATAGPLHVLLHDTILFGNRLTGLGSGLDLYENNFSPPLPSLLVLDVDHTDLGDVVLQGGAKNDLGGNVSVAPALAHGYQLRATSPLIDAATCTNAPPFDIDGDPRPSGATCDIGADEFVP